MHKLLLLAFFGSSLLSYSQDNLLKRDGDSINCKILEIKVNEITYRRTDHLDGPLYTVSKADVTKIIFEGGRVEYFGNSKDKEEESTLENNTKKSAARTMLEIKNYNVDETKSLIKAMIDSLTLNHSDGLGKTNNNSERRLEAEFEGDYLRIYEIYKFGYFYQDKGEEKVKKDLYDFSGHCEFLDISYRGHDDAYIDAYIPRLLNEKKNKWGNGYKFTIKVHGHYNAEVLLEALKHYHELLYKGN